MKMIRKGLLFLSIFTAVFTAQSEAEVFPSGGEIAQKWTTNSTQTITWDKSHFSNFVDIKIWNADKAEYSDIAIGVSNFSGYYEWDIPADFDTGNKFRIKVVDSEDPTNYEISDVFFPIYSGAPAAKEVLMSSDMADMQIFPNPASETLNIQSSGEKITALSITDIEGNIIYQINIEPSNESVIDLTSFATGSYFVKISMDSGVVTKKFNIVK